MKGKGLSYSALLEHILVHYRWVFVMFLLPISFLYDIYFYARSWIVFKDQVKAWGKTDQSKPMCTARPGWQTMSLSDRKYKNRMYQIRVNLVDILEVDADKMTIVCEPLVTMGQLTATLDKLGWTIPIVPELDDLTVGGMVMGTGIETSSHKYGLFQHICISYELVMADGSVITCSKEENADLFYAIPWSYGTLGFLTSVKFQMIPTKRFVKLTYIPASTADEGNRILNEELCKPNPAMFIEALQFSRETSVVMVGELVDACELSKLNEIGLWHKPWFFKHVQEFLSTGKSTEYIPLRDYYHRHSRSLFWEIQDIIPFGNQPRFRYLLGWLVPPKVSLLKLTQGETVRRLYEEKHVVQDMLVPMSELPKSLDFFHQEVEIYPLWICPFTLPINPGMLRCRTGKEEMYVDIGVYGVPKTKSYNNVDTTRRIEQFVRDTGGFQMLYADSYMNEEEYEQMFDQTLYDQMREKYHCKKAFPTAYQKINRKARSQ